MGGGGEFFFPADCYVKLNQTSIFHYVKQIQCFLGGNFFFPADC